MNKIRLVLLALLFASQICIAQKATNTFTFRNTDFMLNGKLVPTIGNVSMDTCMLDATGVDVSEGDEVVIFGKNPTIFDLAKTIETIPYEVLTSISRRVKRIYYQE